MVSCFLLRAAVSSTNTYTCRYTKTYTHIHKYTCMYMCVCVCVCACGREGRGGEGWWVGRWVGGLVGMCWCVCVCCVCCVVSLCWCLCLCAGDCVCCVCWFPPQFPSRLLKLNSLIRQSEWWEDSGTCCSRPVLKPWMGKNQGFLSVNLSEARDNSTWAVSWLAELTVTPLPSPSFPPPPLSPCVRPKSIRRPHVVARVRVLPVHTGTFESTQGGVLNLHTVFFFLRAKPRHTPHHTTQQHTTQHTETEMERETEKEDRERRHDKTKERREAKRREKREDERREKKRRRDEQKKRRRWREIEMRRETPGHYIHIRFVFWIN